jgi:hypothetical protein
MCRTTARSPCIVNRAQSHGCPSSDRSRTDCVGWRRQSDTNLSRSYGKYIRSTEICIGHCRRYDSWRRQLRLLASMGWIDPLFGWRRWNSAIVELQLVVLTNRMRSFLSIRYRRFVHINQPQLEVGTMLRRITIHGLPIKGWFA